MRFRDTATAMLVAVAVLFFTTAFAASDVKPTKAAIASAHKLATAAGFEVLAEGGNAFDAAVAVAGALSVLEPQSSGIGGGGLFLLRRASDGKEVMIDARETAPAAVDPKDYVDANGERESRSLDDRPAVGRDSRRAGGLGLDRGALRATAAVEIARARDPARARRLQARFAHARRARATQGQDRALSGFGGAVSARRRGAEGRLGVQDARSRARARSDRRARQ